MLRRSTLKDPVLVLNKNWQAVGVSTCKKAVRKMFVGHCRYVNMYTHPLAKQYTEVFENLSRTLGREPTAEQVSQVLDLPVVQVAEIARLSKPAFSAHGLTATADGMSGWTDLEPEEGQEYIQTKRLRLVTPHIVMFESYDKMPRMRVRFSRANILIRDNGICQYCGVRVARKGGDDKLRKLHEYTLDHVHPRSRGGAHNWTNVVTCCHKCNNRKADRTPEEAGLKLLKKPEEPKWNNALIKQVANRHDCWSYFLVSKDEDETLVSEAKGGRRSKAIA